MAFTLAHCIVAAPLSKLSGRSIPLASLAIGSMTPDLYRLFTSASGIASHQWSSLFYPNLCIGLLFCFLWYFLYKPTLLNFFEIKNHTNDRYLKSNLIIKCLFIVLGLLLGCITHLLWDGLTHVDERTFLFKTILTQNITFGHFIFPIHSVLQFASSILAMVILIVIFFRYIKHSVFFKNTNKNNTKLGFTILICSLFFGCISSFIYLENNMHLFPNHLYYLFGRILNKFFIGFLISSCLLCILYKYSVKYDKKIPFFK